MASQLSKFEPIAGFDGLFTATRGELRCTAIKLQSGGLCLHSPVAMLSARARESLEGLGTVEFLFAPNHYHNKGVMEYAEAYTTALLVASQTSRPRLEKITKAKFRDLEELSANLPGGMRFEHPAGLKTGEVWLIVRSENCVGWLVVDAFAGGKQGKEERSDAVRLLSTFPKYGLKNRSQFLAWLDDLLRSDPPDVVIPCHGGIVRGRDLSERLRKLVAELA